MIPPMSRARRKQIEHENKEYPVDRLVELDAVAHHAQMVALSAANGAIVEDQTLKLWRNRDFMVKLMRDGDSQFERLTIHRTTRKANGDFDDGITWDELMKLKTMAGFGDRVAVEVYPPNENILNAGNLRHLWLLTENPPYLWKGYHR